LAADILGEVDHFGLSQLPCIRSCSA